VERVQSRKKKHVGTLTIHRPPVPCPSVPPALLSQPLQQVLWKNSPTGRSEELGIGAEVAVGQRAIVSDLTAEVI